ncbi:MAG TPA: hypothetical protein VJ741_04560, partial [Solirubrobacteraceae bacterium]|nr:hypothetical protein [Solirubrobacteraceae bacterium]
MFRGLRFGSGSEIQLGGARYKVESLSAQWVWLMSADGDKIRAGLWETLRSPSFRVVDADAPDVQAL